MYHPPPEFARAGLTRLKSRLYYPGSQKIFQGETQGMYFNFSDYAVDYDPDLQLFSILCGDPGTGVFVEHAAIRFRTLEDKPLQPEAFSSYRDETTLELESLTWRRTYSGGPLATPTLTIGFRLRSDGVRFFCNGRAFISVTGRFRWGEDPEHSTFSVRLNAQTPVLRTASGPAVFHGDDGLFDRLTDRLLIYSTAGEIRTRFDWKSRSYVFDYVNGCDYGRELDFRIRRNYCAEKFHIPYAPIRKEHGFQTPPVGWMTWYALQFDTSEKTVLENAGKFNELFGRYVDKAVLWVDWEWCHRNWDGQGEAGCDIFHPRRAAYPGGLKALSDRLRALGLIPALWIGATNEGRLNESLKKHPEWVLGKMVLWCGQWWIDPSHPGVLSEYIPSIFRQILEWGFQVVKWDCLPATLQACSEMHDRFHDRSQTPARAFRNLVRAARETLGERVYLLSCAGDSERDICGAMDFFNAARIGGDIFSWDDFLEQGINRVLHAYPWHNTVLYADADNLILRPEFSNPEQARTRVSFYGLAGLPVTLGDALSQLDPERVQMLRRIMPVTDIHPTELDSKRHGRRIQITNLAVARPFGNWNVAGIANLTPEKQTVQIDFRKNLDLETGRYAVYDYWNRRFLGVASERCEIELEPFDTRVLRITPLEAGRPALISVSRHLTQGGYELTELTVTATRISGTILCPAEEAVSVTLLLPDQGKEVRSDHPFVREGELVELTLRTAEPGPVSWCLEAAVRE